LIDKNAVLAIGWGRGWQWWVADAPWGAVNVSFLRWWILCITIAAITTVSLLCAVIDGVFYSDQFVISMAGPFSVYYLDMEWSKKEPVALGIVLALLLLAHPVRPRVWTGILTIGAGFAWVVFGLASAHIGV
jgi:hypothetical protein